MKKTTVLGVVGVVIIFIGLAVCAPAWILMLAWGAVAKALGFKTISFGISLAITFVISTIGNLIRGA